MRVGAEILPGGKLLQDRLTKMAARAHDLGPAFAMVERSFQAITAKRFADNGPGWPPLADATMLATGSWARRNDNFDELLVEDGVLYASLQGGGGWYTIASGSMLEMGTRVPYAHWHQLGGFRTHKSGAEWPPQRKIVDLTEQTAIEWAGILAAWVFRGIRSLKGV